MMKNIKILIAFLFLSTAAFSQVNIVSKPQNFITYILVKDSVKAGEVYATLMLVPPSFSTAARPAPGGLVQIIFNTDSGFMQYSTGSSWANFGTGSGGGGGSYTGLYGINITGTTIKWDSANVRKIDTVYRTGDSALTFKVNGGPAHNVVINGDAIKISDSTVKFITPTQAAGFVKYADSVTKYVTPTSMGAYAYPLVGNPSGFLTTNGLPNVVNSLQVINELGAPSVREAAFSARPSAGITGRIFIATDSLKIYRDNGTSWDLISGSGASLQTLQQVINYGNTLTGNNSINIGTGTLNFNGTSALIMPGGTTAQRPTAVTGDMRFSSDSATDEIYTGTKWVGLVTTDKLGSSGISGTGFPYYSGSSATFVSGSSSQLITAAGGVVANNFFNTIGTYGSGTYSANGASYSGAAIIFQPPNSTGPGLMTYAEKLWADSGVNQLFKDSFYVKNIPTGGSGISQSYVNGDSTFISKVIGINGVIITKLTDSTIQYQADSSKYATRYFDSTNKSIVGSVHFKIGDGGSNTPAAGTHTFTASSFVNNTPLVAVFKDGVIIDTITRASLPFYKTSGATGLVTFYNIGSGFSDSSDYIFLYNTLGIASGGGSGAYTFSSPNGTINIAGGTSITMDVAHPNSRPALTSSSTMTFSLVAGDIIEYVDATPASTSTAFTVTSSDGTTLVSPYALSTGLNHFWAGYEASGSVTITVSGITSSTTVTLIKVQ